MQHVPICTLTTLLFRLVWQLRATLYHSLSMPLYYLFISLLSHYISHVIYVTGKLLIEVDMNHIPESMLHKSDHEITDECPPPIPPKKSPIHIDLHPGGPSNNMYV